MEQGRGERKQFPALFALARVEEERHVLLVVRDHEFVAAVAGVRVRQFDGFGVLGQAQSVGYRELEHWAKCRARRAGWAFLCGMQLGDLPFFGGTQMP